MASFMFNAGKKGLMDGTIDLDTNTIKALLLKAIDTDAIMRDTATITALLATAADECDATNYAGGFAGAGRKTQTVTVTANNTDDRGDMAIAADITWTALGGASNNNIVGVVFYKHITDDNTSVPICYVALTSTPTNGGDFTLQWPTDGATARCVIKSTG